jgi:hypothetical protein
MVSTTKWRLRGKAQVHGTPLFSGKGGGGRRPPGGEAPRPLRCWGKTQGKALKRWVGTAFAPPRGGKKSRAQ